MIYDYLDIEITLRCNGSCLNCIKLCGMQDVTGLDYSNSDMTIGQIRNFIAQVKALGSKNKPVIAQLYITGGEPLLHPNIVEITKLLQNELVAKKYAAKLNINSNMLIDPPKELAQYIVCFSRVNLKPLIHNTVLLHPNMITCNQPTFIKCNHYRKWRVVLNRHGYNLCCAADGYIRLFALEDLIIDKLPSNILQFPTDEMDQVCNHCPFCSENIPFEKDMGQPVSKIYEYQAKLNKAGRKIYKTFGERKQKP